MNRISWEKVENNHRVIMAGGDCRWCTRNGGDHDGECEYDDVVGKSESVRSVEIWNEEQALWVKEHNLWKKKHNLI